MEGDNLFCFSAKTESQHLEEAKTPPDRVSPSLSPSISFFPYMDLSFPQILRYHEFLATLGQSARGNFRPHLPSNISGIMRH